MTKSLGTFKPRLKLSKEQLEQLRTSYAEKDTATLAAEFSCTTRQLYSIAYRLSLKKSPEYMQSNASGRLMSGSNLGEKWRFHKGIQPWNKGMKGVNFGGKETQFKPGHRGGASLEKYKPVGTERITRDGYLERKVNDEMPFQKRWRAVHLIIWERFNGPMPAGHAVIFRDGNKKNLEIENLELVTRAQLMKRNSFHNYGQEIAQLVQLRGAITRQINKRMEKGTENE